MGTIRGIFAAVTIGLLFTACTNPFAPDDRADPPPSEQDRGQEERQALAPVGMSPYLL